MAYDKHSPGTDARYEQSTGLFLILSVVDDGNVERVLYEQRGYAGRGDHKNDPSAQCVIGKGPLPRNLYRVGAPSDHPRLGPLAFPLFPVKRDAMCGRSGFFIHGDSRRNPGNASHGCIILDRLCRDAIVQYGVRFLEVVRGPVPDPAAAGGDLNLS